jgi:hypothetical protein
MDVRHGWVEKFHGDELIVALPQLGVVQAALREYGVQFGDGDVEENAALRLARLSGLNGIEEAARRLEEEPSVGPALTAYRNARTAAHPEAPEVSALARVIEGLRLLLDRRYPGWQLAIGKNYRPSLIKGYPHTGGGGEGEPTPTGEPFTNGIDPVAGDREPRRGVRVGVLDTRLFPHQGLAGRYIGRPADLLPAGQREFTEFDGHCTFVASCILQQAPAAELQLRHVLDGDGDGSAWEAAVGIAELLPLGLDVVNLSFGEYMTDDDSAPMVLDAAIGRFSRDTVVVAAAGNNGAVDTCRTPDMPAGLQPRTTSYPAALPDVVGVGALDPYDKPAPFTPPEVPWISLLARGADVNAAYVDGEVTLAGPGEPRRLRFNGTANWAGCSFAAGVVTGVIAARTEPGRRSAREALDELVQSLTDRPRQGLLLNLAGH